MRHVIVEDEEADQRLDRWFKRRFPHIPHGRLEKMLRKGEIRLDGARAKAADRVAAGQTVRVPPLPSADAAPAAGPAPREPRVSAPISAEDAAFIQSLVIHRDRSVLALNKPPGLSVQGGSGQYRHVDGLLAALAFERDEPPKLIHRLDKDTSGVLLLGRNARAARALAAAFKSRATKKLYWAAVAGAPKPRMGVIRYGLVKAGGGGRGLGEKMRCVLPDEVDAIEGAKRAVTDFAVIDALGDRAAWMALRPVTGRTHQLRAHMAEIGHPVVGDGKYGTNQSIREDGRWGAQLGGDISRKLHLHARRIDLPHPDGDGRLRVVAGLPEHMARTWSAFGWGEADAPDDPFGDEGDDLDAGFSAA